jgi:hypothetical protein
VHRLSEKEKNYDPLSEAGRLWQKVPKGHSNLKTKLSGEDKEFSQGIVDHNFTPR